MKRRALLKSLLGLTSLIPVKFAAAETMQGNRRMSDITPNVVVSMPNQLFTMPRAFKAAAGGKVYVGEVDTDPTIPSNQIQVYLANEDGTNTPVSQPISINMGGYPVYSGQIAKFVTVKNHSMAVYDANDVQLFYYPDILKYSPDQLRADLSGPNGDALVGHGDTTVQAMLNDMAHKSGEDFTGKITAPAVTVLSEFGNLIVGDQPVGVPGAVWPLPDSLRDAINVSRKLQNTPLNCHAFSDKTVINQGSAVDGYGAFDSTLIIYGSHHQEHAHSYQDRISYQGTGRLDNTYGYYSAPNIVGSGTVGDRRGIFVNDVAVSGGGHLEQQTGVYLEDLKAATGINVAFQTRQTTGYSWYSPNGGKMYHKGSVGFGVDPVAIGINLPVSFSGTTSTTVYGGLTTDANGASLVVTGDTQIQFVSGSSIRAKIKNNATGQSAFTPGNDNATPLGDVVNRWSAVYAGTGSINTSDERHKPINKFITDELLDAWGDVNWSQFKFDDAITLKGIDGARWHFGLVAQHVEKIFSDKGIDGFQLGLLCLDKWEDQYTRVCTNEGKLVTKTRKVKKPVQVKKTRKVNRPVMVKDTREIFIDDTLPDGKKIKRVVVEQYLRPLTEEIPVIKEDGNPYHHLPIVTEVVTESVDEEYIDTEIVEVTEEYTEPADPEYSDVLEIPAGSRYGIRYEEALSLEAAYQRRRVSDLEERIKKLEDGHLS